VTGVQRLVLAGESLLGPALARAAGRRGMALTAEAGAATGTLLQCRRGATVLSERPMPPDERLGIAISRHALRSILRCWPVARPASAVVLAPAAGVTGPAGAGPVDAVRLARRPVWDGAEEGCLVRLLTVQHSRCWVLSLSGEFLSAEPAASDELVRVPGWLATDTARLAEYAQDRGLHADWLPVFQLGEPSPGPGRLGEVLFAFTEAGYADSLIDLLLAQALAATPARPA
jgi:hypothetical protein